MQKYLKICLTSFLFIQLSKILFKSPVYTVRKIVSVFLSLFQLTDGWAYKIFVENKLRMRLNANSFTHSVDQAKHIITSLIFIKQTFNEIFNIFKQLEEINSIQNPAGILRLGETAV